MRHPEAALILAAQGVGWCSMAVQNLRELNHSEPIRIALEVVSLTFSAIVRLHQRPCKVRMRFHRVTYKFVPPAFLSGHFLSVQRARLVPIWS
ncbi:hypothetical protein D9M68_786220 [compost metagenome]